MKTGRLHTLSLPKRVSGRYWLCDTDNTGHNRQLLSIEAYDETWKLVSDQQVEILNEEGKVIEHITLAPMSFFMINIIKSNERAFIFVEGNENNEFPYKKYVIKGNCVLCIGRTEGNDILYNYQYVSSKHATLSYTNHKWLIEDNNSTNGTFVDGIRIKAQEVKPGSVIYIVGLKIIVGDNFISINNPAERVNINRSLLDNYEYESLSRQVITKKMNSDIDTYFYISPRFKRSFQKAQIKIDSPPAEIKIEKVPLALMLGPSITMGMASLFTAFLTINDIVNNGKNLTSTLPTLVMSFSMVIGTVLWPILTKQFERKQKVKSEAIRKDKYINYLNAIQQEIINECKKQAEIMNENCISIEECVHRLHERSRKLWERTAEHDDFLLLRLGRGDIDLIADISYPEKRFTVDEDPLQAELYKLTDVPKLVRNVPITYSLVEERFSGIIGSRIDVLSMIKNIILQVSVLHSYTEVKLVILFPEEERLEWEPVRWIPHVWDDFNQVRFFACTPEDVNELSVVLEKIIIARKEQKEKRKITDTPHYVVVAADRELVDSCRFMQLLREEESMIGFSVITLYNELQKLPKECSMVIEVNGNDSKIYDKYDITGKIIRFSQDEYKSHDFANAMESIAAVQLNMEEKAFTLPGMLTFLDMFGVGCIEHLNTPLRWKNNNPVITLQTPVGVGTDGKPFYLDLHEKFHGPHGLVAGMTGSGKSEFIITYIMSLAVNYHPDEVAFILIDYKGGGLTGAFENDSCHLPHLAGTITNLDGASIKRSLISIQSELRRRQSIFNQARRAVNEGTMDIYKYQKLYRNGSVTEALPHLFIISDEFAELKMQQPEFMDQLISAARIGRSLGVHLILATQKPSGVVDDQIWSNSRFRVCLKVQEKSDSVDMIKRADAAEISATGRFYLQVGFNELFSMGQSAWSGAPYIPKDYVNHEENRSVILIDDVGRKVREIKIDQHTDSNDKNCKQNVEILKYLYELAEKENAFAKPLWLKELPSQLYLKDLLKKYTYQKEWGILNPIIGEYDDPYNQRQGLLTLPISQEGNAVLYGSTGSGKTTFITSILYHLLSCHTAEELNVYIIDMGSETLRSFSSAPQIGTVACSDDNEKIANLFSLLCIEVERRKKLFSEKGGSYVEYSKSNHDTPNWLVIINNFSAFIENYEKHEETLLYLTREGLKLGIYFLLTSAGTNAIRYRMLQNFKQLITLQLNDKSEYTGVFGSLDGMLPASYAGRGLIKTDVVYEYQTALIAENSEQTSFEISRLCMEANQNCTKRARVVPVLPERVTRQHFNLNILNLRKIPVGITKKSLKPEYINLQDSNVNFVITQETESNGVLSAVAELIHLSGKAKVMIIDPENEAADITGVEHDTDKLETVVVSLFQKMVERNQLYKSATQPDETTNEFTWLVYVIHSFGQLMNRLSSDGKDKLKVLLEKCEKEYNVRFIIHLDVATWNSIAYEAWYRKQRNDAGIVWIGDGAFDNQQIKISRVIGDSNEGMKEGFAYLINGSRYQLIKCITIPEGDEADEKNTIGNISACGWDEA